MPFCGSPTRKEASVGRTGEYLYAGWDFEPTAKIPGNWNVFPKADDRAAGTAS